jgi:hypothetical protein
MAKCDFTFSAFDGAASLLQKAKKAITDIGGELTGDNTSGSFKLPTPLGTVKGNYTMSDTAINLSITDKPMLISCNKIEEKLKQYIAPVA